MLNDLPRPFAIPLARACFVIWERIVSTSADDEGAEREGDEKAVADGAEGDLGDGHAASLSGADR